MIESAFGTLSDYTDEFMLYGLAAVPIIAGVSKLLSPELWLGFHVQSLIPLPEMQMIYLAGAVELLSGLALLTRYKSHIVSGVVGVWLLAITVQVAYKQLWLTAFRDLGLTVFAFSVALNEYRRNN